MYLSAAGPSPPSSQTIPKSTSEDGTASRRPWLPSESQPNPVGGGPAASTASSTILRISVSKTTEMIPLICLGASPPWWRPITAG